MTSESGVVDCSDQVEGSMGSLEDRASPIARQIKQNLIVFGFDHYHCDQHRSCDYAKLLAQ